MTHPGIGDTTITLDEYRAIEDRLDHPLTWSRAWYHRSQTQVADDHQAAAGGNSPASGGLVRTKVAGSNW